MLAIEYMLNQIDVIGAQSIFDILNTLITAQNVFYRLSGPE